jgi:hypothetical protein
LQLWGVRSRRASSIFGGMVASGDGLVGRGAPWRKKMRTAVMVHAARRRRQRGPAVRPGGGGGGGVRGEGPAGDDVWMRNWGLLWICEPSKLVQSFWAQMGRPGEQKREGKSFWTRPKPAVLSGHSRLRLYGRIQSH